MLARICTKNKNNQDIRKLTREKFAACTFIITDGMWHGEWEHSLIIEILIEDDNPKGAFISTIRQKVESLAYAIKKLNKQENVLVQYLPCESKLV
jgi:hypothetical protein